jgi:polyhydroxyalkanoate synthesis regulator phasin
MNSNNLLDLLQTGLRVSLGATTSLVETISDSQKREESLSQLRLEFSQRVTEWAEKGAITEQEARSFIEQMWRQKSAPGRSSATETPSDISVTPPTAASPNAQLELEELTAQIAAIRTELEKSRNSDLDS